MLRVGVIGCGYWGPNLVRNFTEANNAQVVSCCDLRKERLDFIRSRYPFVQTTTTYQDILQNPHIDAIAIATPSSTHFTIARHALLQGKHVLVEKPLALTSAQAQELIELAQRAGTVLMVDHTFVYTGAVHKIKEIVDSGELGDLYYFDSVRINLGLFRHDTNVLWDLASHDVSIMDYVLGKRALAVSAIGVCHISDAIENMAYLTVFFDKPLIAHIHVNWLAPVKIRKTLICGSRKMVIYDDIEPSEKVKVYDAGITIDQKPEDIYKIKVSYRTGDMYSPRIDLTEALKVECEHFVNCIQNKAKPITDGEAGLELVRILETAQRSMDAGGVKIELR